MANVMKAMLVTCALAVWPLPVAADSAPAYPPLYPEPAYPQAYRGPVYGPPSLPRPYDRSEDDYEDALPPPGLDPRALSPRPSADMPSAQRPAIPVLPLPWQ